MQITQNHKVDLLDCTLRDGSYALDFQFTAKDTALICGALEEAGVRLIEIGHGFGLGASGQKFGVAAATDEEYLRAASASLKKARFGAFFIPGIGTKEQLELARAYDMSFVRIGTNITQSAEAEPYIKYARKLGFEVAYNAMKSYVVSPAEFLERVKQTVDWGAEIVYLVDSAGGMLPSEVKRYIELLQNGVAARLGFHGHNNFMLATANSLAALETGATLLDSTIQGIGRSSGNAQTEVLAALYEKLGIETEMDIIKLMNLGEELIRPRMKASAGISALDLTMAQAQFHSSYLNRIVKAAARFGIDEKLLIMEVSKLDRIDPSEDLVLGVAARLSPKNRAASTWATSCKAEMFA